MSEDPEGVHATPREGPFSALTPSMWPSAQQRKMQQKADRKRIQKQKRSEEEEEEEEEEDKVEREADGGEEEDHTTYDEFGFKIEKEDGPEDSSNRLLSEPFQQDDPRRRLEWIAHVEFAGGKESAMAVAAHGGGPAAASPGKRKRDSMAWDAMVENITRTEKLR